MTWRNTDPFQEGKITQIYYCNGRSYKTYGGAKKYNPGSRIYLVSMSYEEIHEDSN